jgi:hypothetical protein
MLKTTVTRFLSIVIRFAPRISRPVVALSIAG